jgi:hypothetical protein
VTRLYRPSMGADMRLRSRRLSSLLSKSQGDVPPMCPVVDGLTLKRQLQSWRTDHALRLKASYGDRDVKRASIDPELKALAVPDPTPRRGRDSGATVTGI